MALQAASRVPAASRPEADHAGAEAIKAAFDYRDQVCTHPGLLDVSLPVDRQRARPGSRARAYLHTAAVVAVDAAGTAVSSLVSLFDDFGAGTFVPEGGFALNNRGAGFTAPPNDARAGKWPVHTLSPVIFLGGGGDTAARAGAAAGDAGGAGRVIALATPGADGQVQTLLQVLRHAGEAGWEAAIAGPRWRTEGPGLLVEQAHPHAAALRGFGHTVTVVPDGDDRIGSVVAAGLRGGFPFAAADWRRQAWAGVA
jgi:gamma-glutamyltranspeptidase/glutathione hydrolase